MEAVRGGRPAVAPAVALPAVTPAAAPHPAGMVEALKEAFTADTAEREMRHSAELHALRQSHAAELAARDQETAARLRAYQEQVTADVTARDERLRGELQARHEAYIADASAREERNTGQLRALQQKLDEGHAQVAELVQALDAERQLSAKRQDRVERLEARLRDVVTKSHQAALDAAGRLADIADLHEGAVKRGDELVEQVALHEAAVEQLKATIEQQRADRQQLMHERQAARDRCVELESHLHAVMTDARHLAEGLRRLEDERVTERRADEQPERALSQPPRLRLAGASDSA